MNFLIQLSFEKIVFSELIVILIDLKIECDIYQTIISIPLEIT